LKAANLALLTLGSGLLAMTKAIAIEIHALGGKSFQSSSKPG